MIMADELGWTDKWCTGELDAYLANATREYGVTPSS
jgi:hypothetical protein